MTCGASIKAGTKNCTENLLGEVIELLFDDKSGENIESFFNSIQQLSMRLHRANLLLEARHIQLGKDTPQNAKG